MSLQLDSMKELDCRLIFHLAFPALDMNDTKRFYVEGLGCRLGRETELAITFNLGGHQIIAHKVMVLPPIQQGIYPRHFGLILSSESEWQEWHDRAQQKGLKFYQASRKRFPESRLEHTTFFLEDPSHNLLEFKHYRYDSAIFFERQDARVGEDSE